MTLDISGAPIASDTTDHAPPGRRPRVPWAPDLSASLVVFLIAVPFSLGIALATGAPLTSGLAAAAVGGIVVGLFGGTPLQVSGPSAALTVITAGLISQYGWQATCAITLAAGLLQLLLGVRRVARTALAVSPAIVHGMLAGVGLTIAIAQLHVVLGGSPQSSATANLLALPGQLAVPHPAALAVGTVTAVVLLGWPRLNRLPGRAGVFGSRLVRVPGPLAAVAFATTLSVALDLRLARVELPAWQPHDLVPDLPHGPLPAVLAAVLTVTAVASVESLLSAVAVDRMSHRTGDLDRELRGQGLANMVSGLVGGLPIAGGAVRSTANVRAGATSRRSSILHGVWVLAAALALTGGLRRIPLSALAALVLVVGLQMVSFAHIRKVHRHREFPVYLATVAGVVLLGVLPGVALGAATAVLLALYRLTRAHVDVLTGPDGLFTVETHGPLTFTAVPRLSRSLAGIPAGADVAVVHDGSFLDHAAYETLHSWRTGYQAGGGRVSMVTHRQDDEVLDPDGTVRTGSSPGPHRCRAWTPWVGHHCVEQQEDPHGRLLDGVRVFQLHTAPLVRPELARLAREGQTPSQLFLTCADSRMVTSMITNSGPGDLFTVRNVGNLVPAPFEPGAADDSVAAAVQYAVEVLEVGSITVCGHSGCGAMKALLDGLHEQPGPPTPLARWLRNGRGSLDRLRRVPAEFTARPVVDLVEQLCITNVVQQLDQLLANPAVERRVAEGTLRLVGMYFDFATAQAYVLDRESGRFSPVEALGAPGETTPRAHTHAPAAAVMAATAVASAASTSAADCDTPERVKEFEEVPPSGTDPSDATRTGGGPGLAA
ncbi:bifunctional SulP family inorganic anion transporter/carbonic anhydrase [Streptomyces sp. BE303]|uniref:bifunctional SulP family inorganic anion transporter/carbonic anhydrase n=1 Tax=Streptomyces sp. BE303 TaxID=3002528 RepID=UPI002E767F4C|nr:bifunctional SulP family inorganic anion transporter/carbonic anhydrase [Streptomyces sp. BE303]MED7954625.1 bifunctional SulP family inorganic anion transporter/carbonic anhydrase [Streptomyces sp. BE303]